MGSFGDPQNPQDPKKNPLGDVGRPLSAPKCNGGSASQRPHRDTRRPASAPWWLTVELQVEYSPPQDPHGDIWGPRRPPGPPPNTTGRCGAPPIASQSYQRFGISETPYGHTGTLGDPRAPPGGSQRDCRWSADPQDPHGDIWGPRRPSGPPKEKPQTPPPQKKTHRAIWGAPYGLPELSAVWHLRDPIGTHWDTRRLRAPPGGSPRHCR